MTSNQSSAMAPSCTTKPDTPLLLLAPPPLPVPSTATGSTSSSNYRNAGGATTSHEPLHRLPPPPSRVKIQTPRSTSANPSKNRLLLRPRRTNFFVWLTAAVCFALSISIILGGATTLVVFLVIKPRYPLFDVVGGSLGSVYLDTPLFLNADLTLQANFSNPNRRIELLFELSRLDLFFSGELIATHWVQPFDLRRGESRTVTVHMITSEVYLPINLSLELQKQVQRNGIVYFLHGRFRVRAELGLLHFSYWIDARCRIELTAPPTGAVVAHTCRTKR